MVRVNYPPGGETHLHSEAKREPKTVRVLKPPGGGSSICFTDDDFTTKRTVKNGASPPSTPTTSECSNGSLQNDDVKNDNVKCHSPTDEVCQLEGASAEKNGMANGDSVLDPKPLPSSPIPSENSTEPSFARESSPSPNSNGRCSPGAESNVSSDSHNAPKALSDVADSGVSDGENEPSLAPLKISSHDSPSPTDPSTQISSTPAPNPSVSVKSDEGTKDRVLGHSVPSNSSTQSGAVSPTREAPRKVVDHMRSNIFMSDGDYTPTRSSRFNAPKPSEDVSQNTQPTAGQRQRVPPGGFSTKLW